MNATPFGFRILGGCHESRVCVEHTRAFAAYASCDARASVGRESYLSAFTFGDDFRALLESTGSVKGFDGACWSAWLWFDIDAADLDAAYGKEGGVDGGEGWYEFGGLNGATTRVAT